MITAVVVGGVGILLVVGMWQLTVTGFGPAATTADHVLAPETVTSASAEDGTGFLDRRRLYDAGFIFLELATVVMAVWTTVTVLTRPGVPVAFEALFIAALAVGSLLVGRGAVVRLGLFSRAESPREAVAVTLGAGATEPFLAVRTALADTRGPGADAHTAAVLAGAYNDASPSDLRSWAERVDVNPDAVEARVDDLVNADVLAKADGRLTITGSFENASPDQLATVAVSVLASSAVEGGVGQCETVARKDVSSDGARRG
jgi:hypothetical protein